jgi:hypothetical protein
MEDNDVRPARVMARNNPTPSHQGFFSGIDLNHGFGHKNERQYPTNRKNRRTK